MPRDLVKPARLGRLRRLLVLYDADLWGPDWLWDWITQNDPKADLYVTITQSLHRKPADWSPNPYGVTNLSDGIGVYVAEGVERVAVAVDANAQHYPSPYFRRMLLDAVNQHRRYSQTVEANATANRLLAA